MKTYVMGGRRCGVCGQSKPKDQFPKETICYDCLARYQRRLGERDARLVEERNEGRPSL